MRTETIADIVREMREQGKYNKENTDLDWKTEEVGDLQLRLADRIEAAVRRLRSRCYAAVDSEYDCAHGCEIREAFKGEVNDGV